MIFIDGEKVIKYHIHGELQGDLEIEGLTTLKDTYNRLKEIKAFDKSHYIDDIYWIECETDTTMWGNYTIRTYKGKYKLVPMKVR